MLIGTIAYTSVHQRAQVKADQSSAAQIGRTLVIRETDIEPDKGVPYYPTIIVYDDLEGIENYIAKDIKPQSMKDGCYVTTAIQTKYGKKILVGIGKIGDELMDKPYISGKEAGWIWSEEIEISEFLEENQIKFAQGAIIPGIPENSGSSGETTTYTLAVGINNTLIAKIQKEQGASTTITSGGTYTSWEISGISQTGPNINFKMPGNDVSIIGITGE